jgi:hypothetical protein
MENDSLLDIRIDGKLLPNREIGYEVFWVEFL